MLCYVTPREHLGLPNLEDVRRGVIAHRIAAHAADVARGVPGARDRDDQMARARFNFDWEQQFDLALDPATARRMKAEASDPVEEEDGDQEYCTMCGKDFCAMRVTRGLKGL